MSSILCNLHHLRVNRFGSIRVADNVLSCNHLKPSAGSGITPISNLQMIAVAIERVTQERGTGILDGSARRNQQVQCRMICHRLSGSRHNGIIHSHLVAVIIRETFMSGTGSVRPSLMPHQFSLRTTRLYTGNQIRKRCVRTVLTGFSARLLQADVIPVFIGQCLR